MRFRSFLSSVVFVGSAGVAIFAGCVSRSKGKGSATGKENAVAISSGSAGAGAEPTAVCPSGTRFNSFPRVCVTRGGFALGPFPLQLQELCREKSPEDASTCVQKQDWPFELLMTLVSNYKQGCPPGTSPGRSGVCIGSDNIYGPFTLQQIMACRATVPAVQQNQCDEIVWPPDFLKFANEETPAAVKTEIAKSEIVKPEIVKPEGTKSAESDGKSSASGEQRSEPTSAEAPTPEGEKKPSSDQAQKSSAEPTSATVAVEPSPKSNVPPEETPKAPTYCVYSWDERPGTADFTTIDRRLLSLKQPQSYPLDRDEESSLLGNKDFHALDVCGRARFLRGCFHQVVHDPHLPAAQTFRAWATGRLRPVEAYMAFVMSQTRLGLWHDDCWRGRCRGIGLARVSAAVATSGRKLPPEDPAWRGITHNMLTNLRYGMRLIASKAASGSSDLYQLAYSFNGIPGKRERFAQDVEKYYRQLLSCQLD